MPIRPPLLRRSIGSVALPDDATPTAELAVKAVTLGPVKDSALEMAEDEEEDDTTASGTAPTILVC